MSIRPAKGTACVKALRKGRRLKATRKWKTERARSVLQEAPSGCPGGLGLGAGAQTECEAPVRRLPRWSGQKTTAMDQGGDVGNKQTE